MKIENIDKRKSDISSICRCVFLIDTNIAFYFIESVNEDKENR